MRENVTIRPMTKDFILYRCLHGGPLSRETIGQCNPGDNRQWWEQMQAERRFDKNLCFHERLIDAYGSSAMLAWDGDKVVGYVRFYPKVLSSLAEPGGLCMQGGPPAGLTDEMPKAELPTFDDLPEKMLMVHCMMTGSPSQKENPYQRVGIGSRMARKLIQWASREGWQAIEAPAYMDLPHIYAITGAAGRQFWEKLGFQVAEKRRELAMQGEFLALLQRQAVEQGMDPKEVQTRYTMRLDLT